MSHYRTLSLISTSAPIIICCFIFLGITSNKSHSNTIRRYQYTTRPSLIDGYMYTAQQRLQHFPEKDMCIRICVWQQLLAYGDHLFFSSSFSSNVIISIRHVNVNMHVTFYPTFFIFYPFFFPLQPLSIPYLHTSQGVIDHL